MMRFSRSRKGYIGYSTGDIEGIAGIATASYAC